MSVGQSVSASCLLRDLKFCQVPEVAAFAMTPLCSIDAATRLCASLHVSMH